jgi:hypothetical protein
VELLSHPRFMNSNKFSNTELDAWEWKAQAYGYDPKEKNDAKRLRRYSLEEYFRLTFPGEAVKEWDLIKPLKLIENSNYAYDPRTDGKSEVEFKKRLGEKFTSVDLLYFMCEYSRKTFNSHIV